MAQSLNIRHSQIVYNFVPNVSIRKRVFEFEDELKNEFITPFQSNSIPDNIDPNIPRFEAASIHKHSRLQVSQVRATLATSYNDTMRSYNDIESYIDNKCSILSSLLQKEKIEFVAFVLELNIEMPQSEINKYLKNGTEVKAISDDCLDFSLLYSKPYKDNYYLNIKISKFTEQQVKIEGNRIFPTGESKHGISIILDVNSKLSFIKNKSYDPSLYNSLKQEVFAIINSKSLDDYLKGNI